MNTMLILSRRQLPIILGCIVISALVLTAYQQGRASGRQERTAYYTQILAERDRAAARASAEALQHLRSEVESAAALERQALQEQLRRVQEQKVVTRVVKEYIDARPSLDQCRLDADGLRLWNAGNGRRPRLGAAARRP